MATDKYLPRGENPFKGHIWLQQKSIFVCFFIENKIFFVFGKMCSSLDKLFITFVGYLFARNISNLYQKQLGDQHDVNWPLRQNVCNPLFIQPQWSHSELFIIVESSNYIYTNDIHTISSPAKSGLFPVLWHCVIIEIRCYASSHIKGFNDLVINSNGGSQAKFNTSYPFHRTCLLSQTVSFF